MADASAASGDLAALFRSGTALGLTDGELLRRAARATGGDAEAFFAAIVERHGPMVLRVCRGALGNGPDADDAFQATFLVLARRLREADRLESVGGWLFGVASRVAARARVDAARRDRLDRLAARLAVVSADPTDADRDRAVREEVGRLPSRYREVVLLCFWEGLTQEQAADRLGRPIGTVRSRSARARDLLRRRLAARGLAPDDFPTPSPTVPPALALAAARGAAELAAGRPTLALVGAHALELSRHVAGRMLMPRLVPIAAVATITLAAGLGVGRAGGRQEPPADAPKHDDHHEAVTPAAAERVVKPADVLIVEVLDAPEGRPISGERPVRPDGRINLGPYGDVEVAGLTIATAKEKVIDRLRGALGDQVLGLVGVAPRDSDRVFVDVVNRDEPGYYVLGDVRAPGKRAMTGGETVLDALQWAGGLTARAAAEGVRLIRPARSDAEKERTLPVNLAGITTYGDPTTNYRLAPGDRLIVPRRADVAAAPLVRATRSTLAEYVIEPPDVLHVDVLDALEGRPIVGEYLVRPDGRIGLGTYGAVDVAGLTITEAKERIVTHLMKYLSDDTLGLWDLDPDTGERKAIAARDSDRVAVDVALYNSKAIYALGAFNAPLRCPFTGSDTLLDLVTYAGGLADDADAQRVTLVRENPRPGEPKTETIDVDAVMRGDEGTKNPQLWPGDRLIAQRLPASRVEPTPADLAPRLDRLEARLDSLLKLLGERGGKP